MTAPIIDSSTREERLDYVLPETRKACNSPELHAFHLIKYAYLYRVLLHLLKSKHYCVSVDFEYTQTIRGRKRGG